MRKLMMAVCLFLFTQQSIASGLTLEAGLHFGGDTLVSATTTAGVDQEITAGGLMSGLIGYEFDVNDDVFLRVATGFKFDFITADNGDVTYMRVPVDVMAFMKTESFNIGAGITQHMANSISGSGVAAGIDADFEDASGFMFQVDYLLNEKGYLGFNYTSIEYDVVGGGTGIDGSSIGIVIGYRFGSE